MTIAKGVKQVAWFDCPGGGQVVVEDGYAFIGHMAPPHGTSVLDVRDPARPRQVAAIEVPRGLHSHKVRVANGLMLVNHELLAPDRSAGPDRAGGLGIYDVADPARPREIARWRCAGSGVHRFTFDGRYAYISPEVAGYLGNIVMILDLADPARPQEVGRWWMPGQWTEGGETPTWSGRAHRCHHGIRAGDRLYVSYWQGGFVILDISDMSRPRRIAGLDWSPPFAWPTHSAVPVPFAIHGRNYLLVADEDVDPLPGVAPDLAAFLWLVDATDETRPMPVSSFQVAGVHGRRNPPMTGCHQPVETIRGTEVPVAWFAQGLRFIDIADPHALRETACFLPDPPPGEERVSSNDVFVDERGLVYLIDRKRGLSIVERV